MTRRHVLRAMILAGALAGASAMSAPGNNAPAKAPEAQDWTRSVAATPEGGFRIGNPGAPLKIVQYSSFTCSHCATFAGRDLPLLVRDYVKPGRASFEYRTYIRDPHDLAAALVATCAGPQSFFGITDHIFAAHRQWTGRFNAMTPAQVKSANALPVPERLSRFAAIGGFSAIAAKAGVPAPRLRQCLSDKALRVRLIRMSRIAENKHGLERTPMFLLNGRRTEAYNLATLRPLLKPRGG